MDNICFFFLLISPINGSTQAIPRIIGKAIPIGKNDMVRVNAMAVQAAAEIR